MTALNGDISNTALDANQFARSTLVQLSNPPVVDAGALELLQSTASAGAQRTWQPFSHNDLVSIPLFMKNLRTGLLQPTDQYVTELEVGDLARLVPSHRAGRDMRAELKQKAAALKAAQRALLKSASRSSSANEPEPPADPRDTNSASKRSAAGRRPSAGPVTRAQPPTEHTTAAAGFKARSQEDELDGDRKQDVDQDDSEAEADEFGDVVPETIGRPASAEKARKLRLQAATSGGRHKRLVSSFM